jgi:hypothetical protein
MPTAALYLSYIISSMPLVSASPTVSNYVGASKLLRPWDTFSGTYYFTQSQASQMLSLSLGSELLSVLSISIALEPM